MPMQVVAGAQWGDEGKGRTVDALAGGASHVVRFQGGANAGHTIWTERGRLALHLLPCGVRHPEPLLVLGPGVALEVPRLQHELEVVQALGLPRPRLAISDRCRLLLRSHRLIDQWEEERLGERAFGSTRSGIAPFYAAKATKTAIPVGAIAAGSPGEEAMDRWHDHCATLFPSRYGQPAPSRAGLREECLAAAAAVAPWLADTRTLLQEALARGARVLGECQLGALRDLDQGIVPWTTSISTLASAAAPLLGLPASCITEVIACVKAYSSCVGAGPLPTTVDEATARHLQRFGQEIGGTTGRLRRVGWFDAVAARTGCQLQGATAVSLTVLDALTGLACVRLCTHYLLPDGSRLEVLPPPHLLSRCQPVYEELAGWQEDLARCRTVADLPPAARRYLDRLAALLGVPVRWVGVGPQRGQLLPVA